MSAQAGKLSLVGVFLSAMLCATACGGDSELKESERIEPVHAAAPAPVTFVEPAEEEVEGPVVLDDGRYRARVRAGGNGPYRLRVSVRDGHVRGVWWPNHRGRPMTVFGCELDEYECVGRDRRGRRIRVEVSP